MQLRHLELFIAVAEERHFTRAAERENIVQSGISSAIRSLEDELGTALFLRNTRRVELSATGQLFLPEARRILSTVLSAKAAVAGVHQNLRGRLSIGTIDGLTPFLDLPQLLRTFNVAHPYVKLIVQGSHMSSLFEGLRDGSLDMVFIVIPEALPSALSHDELSNSPMVLVHSGQHRFARLKSCTLAEAIKEKFIDFSPRWGTRHLVDEMFAVEGLEREVDYEVESYDLVSQFVSRDFGVSILPEPIARSRNLPFTQIRSSKRGINLPSWRLGLFRMRNSSGLPSNPPADEFRKRVLDHFEQLDF